MSHFPTAPLFVLGSILVIGYFAGRMAGALRIPHISGYIAAGLIFSPSITGVFEKNQIDVLFTFTSEIALAVIAYAIGGSLKMSQVRVLGRSIWWINLAQGFGAFFCTALAVYIAGRHLLPTVESSTFIPVISLLLGAIAVATAPAATLAIVHELRAKGTFTTTLLGVVALDDALSIIVFSGSLAVADLLLGIDAATAGLLMEALLTVGGAILIGILGGIFFSLFLDPSKRPDINLMLSLGAIFLINGISANLNFSPLLANMVMGFVIINRVEHGDELFHQLDMVEKTLFCLFFFLASAHFDLTVIKSSTMLGISLLIARLIGKVGGTYIGGKLCGAPMLVSKYLGLTLLPQAGLSLGLIFIAKPILPPETFDLILSSMLASIILNEIISPPLVRWTLAKVDEKPRTDKRQ